MGQKSKIDKKAYLCVTDISFDLSRNLVGSSRSQVRSLSLQNVGSVVTPSEKILKINIQFGAF